MPPENTEIARWFSEHVKPHEAALRGYLHDFVAPCDVDDLVQEAYVRLLRFREKSPVGSPRGLLFATARNAARDLFRRRSVRQTDAAVSVDELEEVSDAPSIPETVSREQETALLEQCIQELPPRCREILLLRKFHQLSHREIAERLGIAEHTVEAQLTKALRRCQEFFHRRGVLKER